MNSLSKNISANFLSNIWLTALLIFLTPLYIWFLGVESYGLIGFYLSGISILGILDTGISVATVREIAWLEARPEEREKIPSLFKSMELVYWGVILVLGIGIFIGAYIFGANWFQSKDLEPSLVREALMLMAVSLVVQVPSGLYVAGLMGLQRQVVCSGLLAFFGTLRAFGAILLLWLVASDIRLYFAWQIVVSVLQTGSMRYVLWHKINVEGHPTKFSMEMLRSIRLFAGGMVIATALSIAMMQGDKMILSRMVSLEIFGYYMLAWTVASGLSRVVTPLTQAFYPRFTELVSKGDDVGLAKQFQLASQLMSVLILPPAALIVFYSQPILFVWMGNQAVAEGAAPILAVMVAGTVFTASSYPALSILYSKKQLRTVITVSFVSMIILLPMLVLAIDRFGVMGAATIWGLYGLTLYIAFQTYGHRLMHQAGIISSMLRDFVVPCLASFAVTGIAGYWLNEVGGKIIFIGQLCITLIIGWAVTLWISKDLLKVVLAKFKQTN